MKKINIITAIISLYTLPLLCTMIGTHQTTIQQQSGHYHKFNFFSYSEELNYVNGGITFNYSGTFSNAPVVDITIEVVGAYSSGTVYSP